MSYAVCQYLNWGTLLLCCMHEVLNDMSSSLFSSQISVYRVYACFRRIESDKAVTWCAYVSALFVAILNGYSNNRGGN